MSIENKDEVDRFRKLTALNYADQAKWYLNAFWTAGADREAEEVWKICEGFIKTDHKHGKQGKELNEVLAHHYLQHAGKTMTALELRAELRKIDLDANGEMALLEYLLFKFTRPLKECIHNPQGGEANAQEVANAAAQLESLNKAGDDLIRELAEQKVTEAKAKEAEEQSTKAANDALESEKKAVAKEAAARSAEDMATRQEAAARAAADAARDAADTARAAESKAVKEEADAKLAEQKAVNEETKAKDSEAAAKVAEEKRRAAEAEVQAALDEAKRVDAELQKEKDAYAAEIKRLEVLSTNESVGIVTRSRSAQELAQLKSRDSLPLQKAKLTQEAVVRRVAKLQAAAAKETEAAAKQTKIAVDARAKAEAARQASEVARQAAEAERANAEKERKTSEEAAAAAAKAAATAEEERAAAVAARKLASENREKAERDRQAAVAAKLSAERAREAAEVQTKAVEALVAEIQAKIVEAEKSLAELKSRTAIPHGAIWWMERELKERRSYLPKSKQ